MAGHRLVDQIKEVVDLVDLVSETVRLKRSGRRYSGLCPFHAEKTPSFFVDPDKQLFYCFGCGTGGDVIAFVMKHRGLDFHEAVRYLAERYNIPLEAGSGDPNRAGEKEELYKLIEEAQAFYHGLLFYDRRGKEAHEYLRKRGVPEKLAKEEKLGYAPDEWDALLNHFRRKGFDPEKGIKAGLFVKSSGGRIYDRFRRRLIFPIRDTKGRVVAFGGRSLDGTEPKYLNSPETPIYNKGSLLYQYDRARKALDSLTSGNRFVFLVEGYMDALAFHRVGEFRVVATLGTAFTGRHARLLKRMVDEVVLVYDGDSAGRKAMMRIFPFLLKEQIRASCVLLPEGLDPDDYFRSHNREDFEALFRRRIELGSFVLEEHIRDWDGTTEGKIAVVRELHEFLKDLDDPIILRDYVRKISEGLQVPEDAILFQFKKWSKRRGNSQKLASDKYPAEKGKTTPVYSPEEELIRLVVKNPWVIGEFRDQIREALSCASPALIEVARAVVDAAVQGDGELDVQGVYEKLSTDAAKSALSRIVVDDNPYYDKEMALMACADLIKACKKRGSEIEKSRLKDKLIEANRQGDVETIKVLLKELQALEACEMSIRGGRERI
ncbi:DNA primase [Thermodesulforhabdus norvegica]|uniref:DNA primase n=1 Tax=Thermodesulforhabdus norvegica TaxID=39841 RepID=A0A1I4UKR8_9BACT|nr:DNA primase [Thermodesulforhabdus norvegica]SFM89518.1 DNA primase [Thermodesulforhabdus norvegica]